jgi:hypothetical protein
MTLGPCFTSANLQHTPIPIHTALFHSAVFRIYGILDEQVPESSFAVPISAGKTYTRIVERLELWEAPLRIFVLNT